jgi:SAM-dependent methyltransferase
LNTLKPQKVLDVGSGTGCYSFYLSRDSRIHVSGVEIDPKRVSESGHIARSLERRNVKFFCGNADECLHNFPPDCFDTALAIEVLQYLPDIQLTLQEIYRVLRPDGHLVGHVPALGYLRPNETTLFGDMKIRRMLGDANFQIVKIIPTFGGISQGLCALYDFFSHSRTIVAALFPLILLASAAFRVENPKGRYRFFVARKPAEKMTEDRGIRTEDGGPRTDKSRLSAKSCEVSEEGDALRASGPEAEDR